MKSTRTIRRKRRNKKLAFNEGLLKISTFLLFTNYILETNSDTTFLHKVSQISEQKLPEITEKELALTMLESEFDNLRKVTHKCIQDNEKLF